MTQTVEFPDLEMLLKGYLTANLTDWKPLVDRRFPPTDWQPGYAVVVRDDSGSDAGLTLANRNIGLTVIGSDYGETRRLAERVACLMRPDLVCLALPVADSTVRGPYSLEAIGRSEFYLTAALVVVGHPVTLQ